MSDETPIEVKVEKPGEPVAEPYRARLVITLGHDGSVNVQGPIHDLILSHGLMAAAARAIDRNAERQEGARLIQAAPAALRALRDGV